MEKKQGNVVSARVINVIEVTTKKGTGTENDPITGIIQYWTIDGKLISEKTI